MRVQQVPNSPYFIHYDDEGFCCISKSRESQEPIPESEMQAFLDAVANGLLYERADTSASTRPKKQLLPKAKRKVGRMSSFPRLEN